MKSNAQLPSLSIIIPTQRAQKDLEECLTSLKQINYPASRLQTIIVANAVDQKVIVRLRNHFKVKIIRNSQNKSFAASINQGWNEATGSYIFVTNDDILFPPESLRTLVLFMESHRDVGVSGGKIVSKQTPQQLVASGYRMNCWTGIISPLLHATAIQYPDWISGCALLIKKTLLQKLGGLDEGFDHFFEDYDLCFRVKKLGFTIVSIPRVSFPHGESTTANQNLRQKYIRWYKNKFRFILKHLPQINVLSIILFHLLLIAPLRLLTFYDGRFAALFSGLWWNMKQTLRQSYES